MTTTSAARERAANGSRIARAHRQTWGLVGIAVVLFAVLRFSFGALSQDPSYHLFADERTWMAIPRAGDVLSNLAILGAGLAGVLLWRRVHIDPGERAAYALLVVGMLMTAFGSAYYHWAPSDARLIWDRLPMTFVLAATVALVLADRVDPAFARVAWWPFALLGIAALAWWAWSGDLLFYLVMRIGSGLLIVGLCLLRTGRHSHIGWLVAALALDIVMTLSERMDREIFAVTQGFLSGHNLKHLLAGVLLACVLMWLVQREPRPTPPVEQKA
ncbi:MAG TPA: hypothetical protein VMM27_14445 [Casimicrobiaceae bacterium]|nr:hypothetical protein [Casimicrobiaceae bacterium]